MIIFENTVRERENIALIYSGLGSISNKGRKRLKNIAQSLITMQNHPGSPIPDSICREIIIGNGYPSTSGSTYIGGNYIYFSSYSGTTYDLSTDSTTAKQAKFEFRITRGDQTISGAVTVNVKKVAKTPEQIKQEAEKAQLESLRDEFKSRFSPNPSSYNGGVVSRFIDKGITAFGQTDVLYTISVRGGTNNYDYEYNSDTGDYDYIYYGTVNLPSINGYNDSGSWTNFVTWDTKTANAAVVLSGTSLKVYTDRTGTAEFSFTYTNSDNKTVKGSVKVTAVK